MTVFNDTSSAAGASIENASGHFDHYAGQTIFNGASSAGHASITNYGTPETHGSGARQLSMAHQLPPTLSSKTGEAVARRADAA